MVVNRVRESINKLVFDTGKEKIRVNFAAGYTSPDLSGDIDFNRMLEQADDALLRAIKSPTEQVICFEDEIETVEPVDVISEQDIEKAFAHILEGNFYQIPEQHLAAIVERLSPFMQYVDNQAETDTSDRSATNLN